MVASPAQSRRLLPWTWPASFHSLFPLFHLFCSRSSSFNHRCLQCCSFNLSLLHLVYLSMFKTAPCWFLPVSDVTKGCPEACSTLTMVLVLHSCLTSTTNPESKQLRFAFSLSLCVQRPGLSRASCSCSCSCSCRVGWAFPHGPGEEPLLGAGRALAFSYSL